MRRENPFAKISQDLRHYARQERVALNASFVVRMFLFTPGFQFVFLRRLQEIVVKIPIVGRILRRILWWLACCIYGSEIGLATKVGGGLYIPHPYGIVLGICTVGSDVAVMQNVTVGRRRPDDDGAAIIGDRALLSAGCVVLGAVSVGEGAIVAANSVLLSDVPPGAIAVGLPARIRMPAKSTALKQETVNDT